MEPPSTNLPAVLGFSHGEHPLVFLNFQAPGESDREWCICTQVATALGYKRPDRLGNLITTKWSNEFIEGHDWVKVEGPRLAMIKAALEQFGAGANGSQTPQQGVCPIVLPKANSLILLSRSGIDLVTMKTNKPAGIALRRWLADEVLPALRTDGFYDLREPSREMLKGMQEARLRRKERARLVYELGHAVRTLHGQELQAVLHSKLELLPIFFNEEEAERIVSYYRPLLARVPMTRSGAQIPLEASIYEELQIRIENAPREIMLRVLELMRTLDSFSAPPAVH